VPSPNPNCDESCESAFPRGLFMHQKCSNYTPTNLFGLCKSMSIISLLVIVPSSHLEAVTHPSAPKVLRARKHAPTPYPFVVFTLWTHN
jgi:hypothetical protein